MNKVEDTLRIADIDRIIEMAWEDRTPFEAIKIQFGLSEKEVIILMRRQLKLSSWRLWRERAQKISHKHVKKETPICLHLSVNNKGLSV